MIQMRKERPLRRRKMLKGEVGKEKKFYNVKVKVTGYYLTE